MRSGSAKMNFSMLPPTLACTPKSLFICIKLNHVTGHAHILSPTVTVAPVTGNLQLKMCPNLWLVDKEPQCFQLNWQMHNWIQKNICMSVFMSVTKYIPDPQEHFPSLLIMYLTTSYKSATSDATLDLVFNSRLSWHVLYFLQYFSSWFFYELL